MFYHHRSFFPAVLALLTLALVGLMFWKLPGDPEPTSAPTPALQPAVTDESYRASAAAIMSEFFVEYAKADQDFLRLLRVEKTLNELLDLKVTEGYKKIHLDLVVALNQMRNGLRGEAAALQVGQAALDELIKDNPWLKP
jgi:hypothetical protein